MNKDIVCETVSTVERSKQERLGEGVLVFIGSGKPCREGPALGRHLRKVRNKPRKYLGGELTGNLEGSCSETEENLESSLLCSFTPSPAPSAPESFGNATWDERCSWLCYRYVA